jgi:predicted alpha-1,2-mannosidase
MQIMNMGNYAHGNQPIQHMIYLYNYAGEPWKTQHWVREVMTRLYNATPDGYCGDEDNGQTSAWYVFSSMGFYPVCPGTDQYVIGAPLFKKIALKLENGNTISINAPANSAENKFVKQINVNGKPYSKNWFSHKSLIDGVTIDFNMSSTPDKERGTRPDDFPFSFSGKK